MTIVKREALLQEIENLPAACIDEVFDFVEYLQQKAQKKNENDVAGYKAMAADTDREQEAQEWCNAYFGPKCNL